MTLMYVRYGCQCATYVYIFCKLHLWEYRTLFLFFYIFEYLIDIEVNSVLFFGWKCEIHPINMITLRIDSSSVLNTILNYRLVNVTWKVSIMMATFSVTENTNRNSPSPTMATAGQLLTTGGTATITVVANASGQTLLVQPTTIVNASPPRHTILKQVSEIVIIRLNSSSIRLKEIVLQYVTSRRQIDHHRN